MAIILKDENLGSHPFFILVGQETIVGRGNRVVPISKGYGVREKGGLLLAVKRIT